MEASGKRYILYGSRKAEFKIYNISDCHLLNAACNEKALDTDIRAIANDPFSFWIGGGDYADFIGYDDGKRFDPDCVSDKLSIKDLGQLGKRSVEMVRDKFRPIAHKCFGLILGNHEKQYQRRHQQEDLHAWLCTELGVANLGYSVLFDIVFCRKARTRAPVYSLESPTEGAESRQSFRVFAHHGAGYAQTPGGKLNRLTEFMKVFDADVYFCGHVHDKVGRRFVQLGADAACKKLTHRVRLGVISGSYLETYKQGKQPSYGEMRGYAPTAMGAAWISITPNTRALSAEI